MAQIDDGMAVPGYTGDDSGIVFSVPNGTTYTGYALYRQDLQADHISPTAEAPTAVFGTGSYGAAFGVVYRRGTYSAPVPNIATSANSLSYGTINTGEIATKALTITNNGNGDLRIDTITLGGTNPTQFKLSGNCSGQTLPASGSCGMNIVFAPTSVGSKTASLSIKSDDPDTPSKTVGLSGSATTVILDTDGDGMPDAWEIQYGLNPYVDDASDDLDGDGWLNIIEYNRSTDPTDPNSHPSKAMPWIPLLLLDD